LKSDQVVVIGAGVAGLVAAIDLSAQGLDVTVVERMPGAGGKLRETAIGDARLDTGPTVFTMRWVFDEILAAAGTSLDAELTLQPADVLARHTWADGERLDLFADIERSADAIRALAGADEADRYRRFCERAERTYRTLLASFIRCTRPSVASLVKSVGIRGLGDLWRIKPFATLWSELGTQFRDPRLRQLFGRYATYCGSSPFEAPATLMLIAHVEREGVWLVDGGMYELAHALERVAKRNGVDFRYDAEVTEILVSNGRTSGISLASGQVIYADSIVVNADVGAIAGGLFGAAVTGAVTAPARAARSQSAVTWAMVAETDGFPLSRHNVFFSPDYRAEFDDVFARARLPSEPTVYVCAQDRGNASFRADRPERLLCLINAPPTGDLHHFESGEIARCEEATFRRLEQAGLRIRRMPHNTRVATPKTFETMFPATGGALYGRTTHGWSASFARQRSRSRVPGLYLAGGGVHPGPGVPMAALSGRMAAASLLADRASRPRFLRAATAGGTSTR
jgi:1-hydroxycarotenoid 3,4-desaturase